MRVGFGFDAHPLVEGKALVLGGVEVAFTHAIMDALLGAASLGDKGHHFPSSDDQYRGISSLILLTRTGEIVREGKWRVVNVDATMLAQRPILAPYMETMKLNISSALSIPEADVSIKATTTDYLGFVGREEGMAAFAVALVEATA